MERFEDSRIVQKEIGRKRVADKIEVLKNEILRDVHVVPEKEPLHLLLRNVAMLVAPARGQSSDLQRIRTRDVDLLENNRLAVARSNLGNFL